MPPKNPHNVKDLRRRLAGRELDVEQDADELLKRLAAICDRIAMGQYDEARDLFELTRAEIYPSVVAEMAESFGMMLVKVEAREYRLEALVDDLKRSQAELEAARRRLASENVILKKDLRSRFSLDRIIGQSGQMRELLRMVGKIADVPVNVLVTGETGTGKGLVAKALHYNSVRCDKPFVSLNCSAIPATLFESELFGIERGVATGVEMRPGRIEQAHGGTIFLDEIGDMPLEAQAKILKVIEDHEVVRVGGRKSLVVDVRLVAATNKDLKAEVGEGRFREDLFYRLNVVHLRIPPLRERRSDIPLLLKSLLASTTNRLGTCSMKFASEALERLVAYDWPGNVRELENEVERAVALAYTDTIGLDDLSEEVRSGASGRAWTGGRATGQILRDSAGDGPADPAHENNLEDKERELVLRVLEQTGGNKSEAARRLGISREGLRKKLKRFG